MLKLATIHRHGAVLHDPPKIARIHFRKHGAHIAPSDERPQPAADGAEIHRQTCLLNIAWRPTAVLPFTFRMPRV